MNKSLAIALASASMLTAAPLFAGAKEVSRHDDRYTTIWRDIPAGRGQTQRIPFRVLKQEYRKQAPYSLTGERRAQKRIVFRDVPAGRGQTQRIAFWVNE